jgi:hypothetical protein
MRDGEKLQAQDGRWCAVRPVFTRQAFALCSPNQRTFLKFNGKQIRKRLTLAPLPVLMASADRYERRHDHYEAILDYGCAALAAKLIRLKMLFEINGRIQVSQQFSIHAAYANFPCDMNMMRAGDYDQCTLGKSTAAR